MPRLIISASQDRAALGPRDLTAILLIDFDVFKVQSSHRLLV